MDSLLNMYIRFPAGEQLQHVIKNFESKWGVPQCVGAIDGYHIPISAPKENHTDYYNRKGWYSMILQGIVDAQYRFLDIRIWDGQGVCTMHESLHTHLYIEELLKAICYQTPMLLSMELASPCIS